MKSKILLIYKIMLLYKEKVIYQLVASLYFYEVSIKKQHSIYETVRR